MGDVQRHQPYQPEPAEHSSGQGQRRHHHTKQALPRDATRVTIPILKEIMNLFRLTAITVLFAAAACAQQAVPCPGLPPGKHSLLERMTAEFGLTCEQELKIEPL